MELKISKLPDEKVTCYNCVHCVHCHTLFPDASIKECVYTPCQFKPDGDIFYEDCFFMSRDGNTHVCTHFWPCTMFKPTNVNTYNQRFMCVGCPHFISKQEGRDVICAYMRAKTKMERDDVYGK